MTSVFIIGLLPVGVMLTVQSSVYRLLLLYSETAHRDLGGSDGLEVCLLLSLPCLEEIE